MMLRLEERVVADCDCVAIRLAGVPVVRASAVLFCFLEKEARECVNGWWNSLSYTVGALAVEGAVERARQNLKVWLGWLAEHSGHDSACGLSTAQTGQTRGCWTTVIYLWWRALCAGCEFNHVWPMGPSVARRG